MRAQQMILDGLAARPTFLASSIMSAAVIVDTFPRWSERFIARELNELKRRGVAFTIYCLKAGDAECEHDPEFADLIAQRVVLPACFLPSFARNLGQDATAKERLKR